MMKHCQKTFVSPQLKQGAEGKIEKQKLLQNFLSYT